MHAVLISIIALNIENCQILWQEIPDWALEFQGDFQVLVLEKIARFSYQFQGKTN
jgi:hypothetical protein